MSFSMDLSCYFEASPMASPLSPLGAEYQFWGVEEDSEASDDDSSSEDEFDTDDEFSEEDEDVDEDEDEFEKHEEFSDDKFDNEFFKLYQYNNEESENCEAHPKESENYEAHPEESTNYEDEMIELKVKFNPNTFNPYLENRLKSFFEKMEETKQTSAKKIKCTPKNEKANFPT